MATERKESAYSYETFVAFLRSAHENISEHAVELYSIKKSSGEVLRCEKIPDLFRTENGVKAVMNFVAAEQPKNLILVQTRPYSDPNPMKEDIFYTKKLYLYLNMSCIKLVDHIIVTPQYDFSFQKNGLMDEIVELDAKKLFKK